MNDFENLKSECQTYYQKKFHTEFEFIDKFESNGFDFSELTWGITKYDSFIKVISYVNPPKRFVVFGCSIGYQCFYWNHMFPKIPCVGVDIMTPRVNWGKSMIEKYSIKNVELFEMDICDFEPQDGDLIWQNNLMFDSFFNNQLNYEIIKNYNVEIISYSYIDGNRENLQFINNKGEMDILNVKSFQIDTSWKNDQEIFYYYKDLDYVTYDVNYILPEFVIPVQNLHSYKEMIYSKKDIKSDLLKKLYNKNNIKKLFIDFGFNVPELYFYTNLNCDITDEIEKLEKFVIKPAHSCESNDVFIKSNKNKNIDFEKINIRLNERINLSDKTHMDIIFKEKDKNYDCYWKDTERGIIIEEYIDVIYELKVFVVFGEPIVADLRTGNTELHRVDFIKKRNPYLNWDKEYNLIKDFSKYLKIDIFRIDFLYNGDKLYASECAFMPGTVLPSEIENIIAQKLRSEYFKYYYPNLC